MSKNNQSTDYKWFVQNLKALYKKYGHKFVVIKNKQVLETHDTFPSAYYSALDKFKLGTFIIQELADDIKDLTEYFASPFLI